MFGGVAQYCRGKRCYDKKGAVTAANGRWKQGHVHLRIYSCEWCGCWHLTKQLRNGEYINKRRGKGRKADTDMLTGW